MTASYYRKLNRRVRSDKTTRDLILILNELSTYLIALIYIICLILLIVRHSYKMLFLLAGAPLAAFCLSRLLRMIIKAPRPYHELKITPLVRRRKTSYSFPSCHTASAFVIGTTLCAVSMTGAGIVVLILSAAVAVLRVLSGAHYVKDVLAGAVIGILFGLLAFFIR